jgi:acetoacetyl-CoA synthetase
MNDVIWSPDDARVTHSQLARYEQWLAETRGLRFATYADLWRWSVDQLDAFWQSIWDFCDIEAGAPARAVLASRAIPGAAWFPGARLNYARHLMRHAAADRPALICVAEDGEPREIAWAELDRAAGALRATLVDAGVRSGDRVVAYVANGASAVVGLIACASIGAIWSACAPDFATSGAVDRFAQLEPKVLIASDGYRFGGRPHDRRAEVEQIAAALECLELVIYDRTLQPGSRLPGVSQCAVLPWEAAIERERPLTFEDVAFDHPLWVLFSSGTTGKPKGIVQSHGGILIEHLKLIALHNDLSAADRFLIITSTTWMVWNVLVSGLLTGTTIVLYDGNPMYPAPDAIWRRAAELGVTAMGVGAAFLHACMKAQLRPGRMFDLATLRSIFSTGSPLSAAGYDWVMQAVGEHIWLNSTSGGTDVCTSMVGGTPILPVRRGRIQAPLLGVDVHAFDDQGNPVVGRRGELVVTQPMPSMPTGFWNDPGDRRYRESYFETYPGVWRQGDSIEFDPDGSSVIHGRSDATLNRRGVRIGTAEIYGAVEALDQIREALVIGVELDDGDYYMPLFVALHEASVTVDDDLASEIRAAIIDALSPRHVPDEIIAVPGIPHTKTGKKLEVPIKKLFQGASADEVCDPAAVDDFALVRTFESIARDASHDSSRVGTGTGG